MRWLFRTDGDGSRKTSFTRIIGTLIIGLMNLRPFRQVVMVRVTSPWVTSPWAIGISGIGSYVVVYPLLAEALAFFVVCLLVLEFLGGN